MDAVGDAEMPMIVVSMELWHENQRTDPCMTHTHGEHCESVSGESTFDNFSAHADGERQGARSSREGGVGKV